MAALGQRDELSVAADIRLQHTTTSKHVICRRQSNLQYKYIHHGINTDLSLSRSHNARSSASFKIRHSKIAYTSAWLRFKISCPLIIAARLCSKRLRLAAHLLKSGI